MPDTGAHLLPRLLTLVGERQLDGVVVAGARPGALLADLGELGLPLVVIDPRPDVAGAFSARAGARVLQGVPARVLADLRHQLPGRGLYVLGPCGLPRATVREQILRLPRGQGVVVVRPGPGWPDVRADLEDALLRWAPEHDVEWVATGDGEIVLLVVPRGAAHVTFLIERYAHEYGSSGPSINLDNLVGTLTASGLATHEVVHYDQCFHEGRPLPLERLGRPATVDDHVAVVTLHYHSRANPTPAELQRLRATGTVVAIVWLDKKISRDWDEYWRVADVNVVLDGNDFELPNALPLFTPKNPRWFHDPGLPRDLDVTVVGEVRHLPQRRAMVERLRAETRVPITVCGTSAADTGRVLAVADYARLYQRSRISLAMTKDSVRQLKGRVFEIVHCGALLCCDVNHHVQHYFAPGREYIEYHDYDHLIDRLRHYLAHEDERAAIAAAGHRRAVMWYGHGVFWRSLLARCRAAARARRAGAAAQEGP